MSLLTEKTKNSFQLNILNEFIDNFESLVDLFTILSFVLIAAAFFFGIQKVQTSESDITGEIDVREIGSRSASQAELPDDIVVIFIANENGKDIIKFKMKESETDKLTVTD